MVHMVFTQLCGRHDGTLLCLCGCLVLHLLSVFVFVFVLFLCFFAGSFACFHLYEYHMDLGNESCLAGPGRPTGCLAWQNL